MMNELVVCPFCGGSGAEGNSSERCTACGGQGKLVDGGPPPAPAGTERGYLARKPCGCAVRWMSYGMSTPFLTEQLAEWRARGWKIEDGLSDVLTSQPPCTHPETAP